MASRSHTSSAAGGSRPARRLETPTEAPTGSLQARDWFPLALVLLLAAAVFSPSFSNAFLNFDDPANITQNALIRQFDWHSLKAWFTTPLMGMYTPLVYVSYAADYQAGGLDVTAYHATNLTIHLLNVTLVWLIARALTGNFSVSAVVAAIFAVHPANVAAVVPLSVRSSLLYSCFYLAAYLAYLSYVRLGAWWRLGLTFVLFSLAALSKSAAVVFPVALVLTDYRFKRVMTRRAVVEKVPFFLAALAFGVVGLLVREDIAAMGQALSYSMPERAFIGLYGLVFYAAKIVAPLGLSAFYTYPERSGGILPIYIYLAPLAVAAAVWMVVKAGASRRVLVFGCLFFLVHISLVLKFLPLGVEFAADRYLYLPAIGLFLVVAELWQRSSGWVRQAGLVCVTACVAVFAVASYARCADWKDSETFYTRILEREPKNVFARNNLGRVLAASNRRSEALVQYREAVRLAPTYVLPRLNLAEALAAEGLRDEALQEYQRVLRLDPQNAKACAGVGLALAQAGRSADAIAYLRESVRLDPEAADARTNLGAALAAQGRLPEAIDQYRQALTLNPGSEAHNNLGAAYAAEGRLDAAAAEFEGALTVAPGLADAHRNLALVRARQNREDDAIREFLEALRLNDNLVDVHFNVAVLLLKKGRRDDARRHLEAVVARSPGDDAARRMLESLVQQNGR